MDTVTTEKISPECSWRKNGIWYLSDLIRDFRRTILGKYPDSPWTSKAKEPRNRDTIAQNLIYLFPGHVLKIPKALCTVLGDEEAESFLSQTKEFTILDLACGAGTASIGVLDFIVQLIKSENIKRNNPLTLSFILNDVEPGCTKAAKSHFEILKKIISSYKLPLRIGKIEVSTNSISDILSYLRSKSTLRKFNLMVMAHPFDPILYHAEKVLEVDPNCTDPIVHARPCDRPGLLGDFYINLGEFADPYFSRALLVQENRYCPLLPVCLPSNELKVIRTLMEQEAINGWFWVHFAVFFILAGLTFYKLRDEW